MLLKWVRHWFFGHYTKRVTRKAVWRLLSTSRTGQGRRQRRRTLRQVDVAAAEIQQLDVGMASDPPSQGHLEWASFILAAYRELLDDFSSPQETIDAIGSAMQRAHGSPLVLFVLDRLMKEFHGDVKRAGKVLDALLKQYGEFFAWQSEVDNNRLTFTITRCWYFHFFASHGVPRVTTCACRLDGLWFNRMDPERHGLRFDYDAYTTKGYGGENCVFPIEIAVSPHLARPPQDVSLPDR